MTLLAAACVLSPLPTPTASPTASPSPTPTASVGTSPRASPSATEGPGAVPSFGAGDLVVTAIDGLRVRQGPGLSSNVVTGLLPRGAELEVAMGPIPIDGHGWYLVSDADAAEPDFDEGWIAAGFEPDAFVTPTGERAPRSTFVASFAHTGNAENGPVEIRSGDHRIRWVAVDPEGTGCAFGVSLAEGGDDPVPAIRATIGNGLVPGTLQPRAFEELGVRGQVFVGVASDCAWALVIERVRPPEPTGAP